MSTPKPESLPLLGVLAIVVTGAGCGSDRTRPPTGASGATLAGAPSSAVAGSHDGGVTGGPEAGGATNQKGGARASAGTSGTAVGQGGAIAAGGLGGATNLAGGATTAGTTATELGGHEGVAGAGTPSDNGGAAGFGFGGADGVSGAAAGGADAPIPQGDAGASDGSVLLSGATLRNGETLTTPDLELTAPSGSLGEDVTVSVSTVSPPAGLPAGLLSVCSAVDIAVEPQSSIELPLLIKQSYGDCGGHSDSPLVVLHYDAEDGYEPVTLLGRDTAAKGVLFEAYTFSPYVVASIDEDSLPPAWPASAAASTFSPVADGWPIANFDDADAGSPFSPGGNCLGMAAYAVWFYQNYPGDQLSSYLESSEWPPSLPPPPADDPAHPYVSPAHLTAIRAHQAQSQYWARFQTHYDILSCSTKSDSCELSPKDRSVLMKYSLSKWASPQVLAMFGFACKGLPPVVGHAVVLYRYDSNVFYFYDVNDALAQRCDAWDSCEHSFTFDAKAGTQGAFGTYANCYSDFGILTLPWYARRVSFPMLISEATDPGGAFTHSSWLSIDQPAAGATVAMGPVTITGSTTLAPSAQLYEYFNATPHVPLITNSGLFSFSEQAIEGPNVMVLLGGTYWKAEDNWTGATLVRKFYGCPPGATWNPNADPPACECPAGTTKDDVAHVCKCPDGSSWDTVAQACPCPGGLTWNPNANPPACECPAGMTWDPVAKVCLGPG